MDTSDLTKFITTASPPVLLILVLNGLGWVLKQVDILPNKYIPLILPLVGSAVFPLIANRAEVSPTVPYPIVWNVIVGFALGSASVAGHTILTRLGKDKEDFPPPDAPKQ